MTHPANGRSFPASKLAMLSQAVLAACDKQDGLADGIIGDPRKCSFDPHTLLCPASADTPSCLTDSEVSMVQALYNGPVRKADRESIFPGWPKPIDVRQRQAHGIVRNFRRVRGSGANVS